MQMTLDASEQSIEFVYGPKFQFGGADAAFGMTSDTTTQVHA